MNHMWPYMRCFQTHMWILTVEATIKWNYEYKLIQTRNKFVWQISTMYMQLNCGFIILKCIIGVESLNLSQNLFKKLAEKIWIKWICKDEKEEFYVDRCAIILHLTCCSMCYRCHFHHHPHFPAYPNDRIDRSPA